MIEKARNPCMGTRLRASGWVKNGYGCGEQLIYDYDVGRWGKVEKD